LRRGNLGAVVRYLHSHGPLTRSALAARTGLNRSTVGDLVGLLTSADVVQETVTGPRTGAGRPSLTVRLGPDRVWALAVEVSAEAVAVARVGLGGSVREGLVEPLRAPFVLTPAAAIATISTLAHDLAGRAPGRSRLVGVAVAVPGVVRRDDGFVHLAPNLSWRNVPFASLLSVRLPGRPVVQVANEADLGALAEHGWGAAVGSRHMIYVSGNTGVGAGIIVDGALLAGRSGYAGEVGHMKVNPDGHRCHCGGRGCWETEIGAGAVLRRSGRRSADLRSGIARVLAKAEAGDQKSVAALHQTGLWIGRGTANLINIFNPELVVFGGALRGIFLAAETVVSEELRRQVLPQAGAEATVVGAGLGNDSVLIGAAELAFSDFLSDPLGVLAATP
jgi:predicted NBD/HSP70 family sugar kinase